MSAARLIPLASLMIDMMVLGQLLPARAAEAGPPAAAAEEAQKGDEAVEAKSKLEPAAAGDQTAPANSAPAARAAAKAAPEHRQAIAPRGNPDPSPAAKPPASIMQMLEGRERELLFAAAIAAAFFAIGWICGGHYYLRRDRYRRTKLRF